MSEMLSKDGCVVEMYGQNIESQSCSGILLDAEDGVVLTHASLLTSIFIKNPNLLKLLSQNKDVKTDTFTKGCKFKILIQKYGKSTKIVNKSQQINLDGDEVAPPEEQLADLKWVSAKTIHLWKSDGFSRIMQKLFSPQDNWRFHEDLDGKSDSKDDKQVLADKVSMTLLGHFLLLKLENVQALAAPSTRIFPAKFLRRGMPIRALSTPFGNLSPAVFFNSVSQGLVSGLAGSNNELILTDARCIPGGQGGPLYVKDAQDQWQLAGMIVLPMCWKSNEWMGLTIGCSLSTILETVTLNYRVVPEYAHSLTTVSPLVKDRQCLVPSIDRWSRHIVFLENGNTWGTGLVADGHRGIIITCSHVVRAANSVRVRFNFSKKWVWAIAEVVYAVDPKEVFDLAVLRIKKPPIEMVKLENLLIKHEISNGEPSYMLGHALFDDHPQMPPLVTEGIISRIVYDKERPILIQSTCSVNAGASGGPLFSQDGHIISLVTCNTKDTSTGASYPHINLSVPMTTVWAIIQQYIKTEDTIHLESLHVRDRKVKALWMMQQNIVSGKMKCKL